MLVSVWKSAQEIQYSLSDARNVAVFSCNVCANLNGTGGKKGLRKMKRLLSQWGKTVVMARTVNICCSEEIMRQCIRIYLKPVQKKCDALVMLACAGGVKCAFFCGPGMPVIAALDSTGSGVVATSRPVREAGICTTCDHCVVSYTRGICPVTECPAKKKYGPCKNAPERSGPCVIDPGRACIWHIIEANGVKMTTLDAVAKIHKSEDYERLSAVHSGGPILPVRRFCGWFMARIPGISPLIDLVRARQ
ncbi:MAG: methylenetetrahydrofolate reductase C-terminal domain-containing protein [Thermodesulfobacteriota bacterium]|nr:methylenetetrahydrofolate reductase C-terminal domain-containing protein [Thermodesulfobacteriota bacterium]